MPFSTAGSSSEISTPEASNAALSSSVSVVTSIEPSLTPACISSDLACCSGVAGDFPVLSPSMIATESSVFSVVPSPSFVPVSTPSPLSAASACSLERPTYLRDSSAISSAFKVPFLSRLSKASLKAGYSVSSSGKLLGLNSSPSADSPSGGSRSALS